MWTAPYVYTFTSAISWHSPSCKSSHYWSYDGMGSLSICLHHSQHVSITWQPRGTRVQHRMSLPVPSQSTLHRSQFVMVKNKNKYLLAKKTLGIYKYHCSIYKLFTWCHWKVVFHHSSLFPKHGSGHFFSETKIQCTGICLGMVRDDYWNVKDKAEFSNSVMLFVPYYKLF